MDLLKKRATRSITCIFKLETKVGPDERLAYLALPPSFQETCHFFKEYINVEKRFTKRELKETTPPPKMGFITMLLKSRTWACMESFIRVWPITPYMEPGSTRTFVEAERDGRQRGLVKSQ